MTKLRKLVSNTCWQENVVIFTSDHFYAGFDLENLFLKYISMVTYNFCCWKVMDSQLQALRDGRPCLFYSSLTVSNICRPF